MKVKELLSEASAPKKPTIADIKQLTNDNFHSEALAAGAHYLGHHELKKKFDDVVAQHVREGGLSKKLSLHRSKLATQLFDHAEKTLSGSTLKKFHDAY